MKKSAFSLLLVSLLFMGQSCGAKQEAPTPVNVPEKKIIQVGEPAEAGAITHTVTKAEQLDAIPASATIEQFKNIAADKKATEGFTYIHLTGKTKNNSELPATIDSNALKIIDDTGEQHKFATDVTLYVEDEKFPTFIDVAPTKTVDWEAYFLVPNVAKNLQLQVTDLQIIPEATAEIELGIANK
jgi:hypothetical protein